MSYTGADFEIHPAKCLMNTVRSVRSLLFLRHSLALRAPRTGEFALIIQLSILVYWITRSELPPLVLQPVNDIYLASRGPGKERVNRRDAQ